MQDTFRLASVFSDHMVLCRDNNIRIFGEAADGREVVVTLGQHTVKVTACNGRFMAVIPPMPAGGPYTMTVFCCGKSLSYSDILIGDVFFAGGQSNMEMELQNSSHGEQYAKDANDPEIRYCIFPVQGFLDDDTLQKERNTKWKVVEPGKCGEISSVAYHFALHLKAKIAVPIGIIGCYLGGTSILSWLDEESVEQYPEAFKILSDYTERNKNKSFKQFDDELRQHERLHQQWFAAANTIKANNPLAIWEDFIEELGPCPWPPPEGPKDVYRPCGLAETMVKRIAPYTLTGFLYYQGESDDHHPYLYKNMMLALIHFWRNIFKDPILPFLFVQLPMFGGQHSQVKNSWAIIRQAQDDVYITVRNTGLAIIIDCGEEKEIHPLDKATVGYRLFLQALRVIYHLNTNSDCPRALDVRNNGKTLIVRVSSPLKHENNPRLFEVAGEDHKFYKAHAEIDDNFITISSENVDCPIAVRYAWVNFGSVNVFGQNGLPLAPFSLM